eukprot:Hpha_TRINITY_DN7962_c0_g2::TRINITY_DN7962_c0_g2_i1::g.146165::m.146165/K13239/PECI; peroxisomal 3,2-trans-enoyl-CoA isomerase
MRSAVLVVRRVGGSGRRWGSSSSNILLKSTQNGVVTLTFNNPKRLNSWSLAMMVALRTSLSQLGEDETVGAVVLTGAGNYYSAGVSLADTIQPMLPRSLRLGITEHNQALFDAFLDFPKPILVAANGPAIGATVTSATLCDAIVAADVATFSTPFAALGVTPEGCSSVHLPRVIGEKSAQRMLGPEGWKPTAAEAKEIGMVEQVVPSGELLDAAQALAEGWIKAGRKRTIPANGNVDELKEVNRKESIDLGYAFLDEPFLKGQQEFLEKRGKSATLFKTLRTLRPLWKHLI